jgi:glucose-6-phosphate 1-dehydrogenase
MTIDQYRTLMQARFNKVELTKRPSPDGLARFAALLKFVRMDLFKPSDYTALGTALGTRNATTVVMYVATALGLFTTVCEQLAVCGPNTPHTRVVLEKPLGHDLASNRAINKTVRSVFEENQIFRIDHYLGKPAVQNLFALRFGSALFEPLW